MTTSAEQTAISIKGLSHSYGNKRILTNINLNIPKGTLCGVIGPNGAGKSTLFKCILKLIDYDFGDIDVLNKEIEEVRKQVAYVPQKDEVDWDFPATVMDIVLMGRYPFKSLFSRLNQEDKDAAQKALIDLGIEKFANRQIGQLSGGQQQRVFIARALVQDADIYFLDEPFVGVDIATEEKIISILQRLANEGKTILVVHHDLSTVKQYFDRVILLNQRLVAAGLTDREFVDRNISMAYGGQLNILHSIGVKSGDAIKSQKTTRRKS